MATDIDIAPPNLYFEDQVFDIDFHPTLDVVAAGIIDGSVEIHRYSNVHHEKQLGLKHHLDSCRVVLFSEDGQVLFSGSSDNSLRAVDVSGAVCWAEVNAHSSPVNVIKCIRSNVIASGDDSGCIKIWDTRQHRCVVEWNEHTDFVSDVTCNDSKDHLLATSGDGTLSVFNLRKNKLEARSDDLDDELLSVQIIKNGKKIVCGSQDGVLAIFSWGAWGDMDNRFPGHPDSIETMLKIDEDTICTGSCDGIIRIVQIHPNKLLGVIGEHEDFPVEVLKFNRTRELIGSVSHENQMQFWDIRYLTDEIDESDDEEENDNDVEMEASSDEEVSSTKNKGPESLRKHIPTANETFFADL